MKKKEFIITIVVFAVFSVGFVATNLILELLNQQSLNWLLVFGIIFLGYLYLRYRLVQPLRSFASKFNMLLDYDLDIEGAIQLASEYVNEAPTRGMKSIYLLHLGMAYYNNGEYEKAVQTFDKIELQKINSVYHVLIFAHQAYAYDELGNDAGFDLALERITNIKDKIHRKFFAFASSYERILTAMKNLKEEPEEYKEVVEAHLSQHNGYISQRLVYHYRLAKYYEVVGDVEEMDKHLARVLANGKSHFTAKEAQDMFQNTVKVDDYVFTEDDFNQPDLEDESLTEKIEDAKELEVFDDTTDNIENKDIK